MPLPKNHSNPPRAAAALALLLAAAAAGLLAGPPARAQGSDPCMIGDIRLFAGDYEPYGWMFARGQSLSISQNTALFSVLETTYGGDGHTSFNLPDLRGRVPVGLFSRGQTNVQLGMRFGAESVTLMPGNVPPHTHALQAAATGATTAAPVAGAALAAVQNGAAYAAAAPDTRLATATVGYSASGQVPVQRTPPSMGMNYIICVSGVYPARG